MGRTRIKICGITSREDAEHAVVAGTDALGFVFYPGSSRYIPPETAVAIIADLPPFLTNVGLFVNATLADIMQTVARGFLQVIQLHGDESPEFCWRLRREVGGLLPVIKAVRVATQEDLLKVRPYCRAVEGTGHDLFSDPLKPQERCSVQAILLDAKVGQHYGGTGHAFDWSLLTTWHDATPMVLAGGLRPDNVALAIRRVRPYAVDVSSGVEMLPGRKDADKMKQFVQQVRQADLHSDRRTDNGTGE